MFIVCLSENRNLIWLTTISQLLILFLEKYLTTICSTHGWSDESVIITTKSTNFHRGKLSHCTLLYWFSIAAITHCRKCSGLRKKKKRVLNVRSMTWISLDSNQKAGRAKELSGGPRKPISITFPASRGLLFAWIWPTSIITPGHTAPFYTNFHSHICLGLILFFCLLFPLFFFFFFWGYNIIFIFFI